MSNFETQPEQGRTEPDSVVIETAASFLTIHQLTGVFGDSYGDYYKGAAEIMRVNFPLHVIESVSEQTGYDKHSLKSNLLGYVALVLENIGPETDFKNPETKLDAEYAKKIMSALSTEMKKWGK